MNFRTLKQKNLSKNFISEKITKMHFPTEILNWKSVSVVLLIGSVLIYMGCGGSSAKNVNVNPNASQAKTVTTKIMTAGVQDVSKYIEATGTFQSDETTDVASETSGKVAETLVNEGDFVGAGRRYCAARPAGCQSSSSAGTFE